MKPRKMQPKNIPARDEKRAFRFYRDLFDFLQDGADVERHLLVDGEDITFFESQEMVDVEILARDHEEETRNHLINYYIDFKESDDVDPKKIRFNFADSEGNNISLQVNR